MTQPTSVHSGSAQPGTTGFRCGTALSHHSDTGTALQECLAVLDPDLVAASSWVLACYTAGHDGSLLATQLAGQVGDAAVQGLSSCRSVMSDEGVDMEAESSLGLFVVSDPGGAYGVGMAPIGDSPRQAAARALEEALESSGRADETPTLVWLGAAPGQEEELLRGLADVVGEEVPVAGGSSADDRVEGLWSQVGGERWHRDAVVVSVLFPSVEMTYAFHSGYDPTPHAGLITAAEGRRIISIDGEPAARVYDRWTEGRISEYLGRGGSILALSTMVPLGREVADREGVKNYVLSHPWTVEPDGSLITFTEHQAGSEVMLMRGTVDNLVSRAVRVTAAARDGLPESTVPILGGLVVYCAGCMMAVGSRMPQVVEEMRSTAGEFPFLGTFTFGEQGCHLGQRNAHGNLMISVVMFRDESIG